MFIRNKIINFILATVATLLLLFILTLGSGCSSVRKSQSSHTETKDSTTVKKLDSVQVSKTNTVVVSIDSSQYKRVIEIEIDTSYNGSNGATESDYSDCDTSRQHPVFIADYNFILDHYRPRKITITETGQLHTYDSTAVSHSDSAATHGSDSTTTKEIIKDSSSSKRKTGMPFLFGTGITIAGLLLLFFWWKKRKHSL